MRLLLVFALCVLATPAAAQRFDIHTVNGVRVWTPKSSPEPVAVAPPLPTISVTVNPANYGAAYPDYADSWGYPAYWGYVWGSRLRHFGRGSFNQGGFGQRSFVHGGFGGRSFLGGGLGFQGGFGRR